MSLTRIVAVLVFIHRHETELSDRAERAFPDER